MTRGWLTVLLGVLTAPVALPVWAMALILLAWMATSAFAADCSPTIRMPYEQSRAIKLSMLPAGHSASEYELDHIVPLCMGGSNARPNLQLQSWIEARRKDIDEVALCDMVQTGVLTCDEAQETMREWVLNSADGVFWREEQGK